MLLPGVDCIYVDFPKSRQITLKIVFGVQENAGVAVICLKFDQMSIRWSIIFSAKSIF